MTDIIKKDNLQSETRMIMKSITIEKVTLNIGIGEAGEKVEKAAKLLAAITGHKVIKTKTMKRIPTWNLRPKLTIGCKVTLRGKEAEELLKRLFKAVSNKLTIRNFDKLGNFAFGIREYIDIPNVNYDPTIGIIGLEAAVTLQRPGFRVKKRKIRRAKIGKDHLVTKEEAIAYIQKEFGVGVE